MATSIACALILAASSTFGVASHLLDLAAAAGFPTGAGSTRALLRFGLFDRFFARPLDRDRDGDRDRDRDRLLFFLRPLDRDRDFDLNLLLLRSAGIRSVK